MTKNPIEFLTKVMPEIIAGAREVSEGLASKGDAKAAQRLEEAAKVDVAMRVLLEGKSKHDLYLALKNSVLTTGPQKPAGTPVMVAISVPYEAAEIALEERADEIEERLGFIKKRVSYLSAAKTKALTDRLAGESLQFHVVIKDTPDFDEVPVKIAVGGAEPTAKPTFTITVDYDTLEQIRGGKIKPQSIMSSLQMTGDVSRAMALGMEVMQLLAR